VQPVEGRALIAALAARDAGVLEHLGDAPAGAGGRPEFLILGVSVLIAGTDPKIQGSAHGVWLPQGLSARSLSTYCVYGKLHLSVQQECVPQGRRKARFADADSAGDFRTAGRALSAL
jgi:hypothetical protein